jgi:NAD(P)-dependent dehydrogenase (short-subunit alcohol dehydrogenase family)
MVAHPRTALITGASSGLGAAIALEMAAQGWKIAISHFGHGIHFCLGASLARLEGRVALDEVPARWTEWEIDHEGAEMARTSTVRGWKSLPARIYPHRSATGKRGYA